MARSRGVKNEQWDWLLEGARIIVVEDATIVAKKIKSLARGEENKQILRRATVGSGIHPRFTLAEQSPVSQHKDTADLAVRPKWRSGRAGG